jgi:hypothetical protein
MTQAIPVSQIATVNPAVVGAGGNPLSLNAIMLDTNGMVPTSGLLSFSTPDDASDYFGSNSPEAGLADNYFLGFDNSTKKPGTLFFAGYAVTDTSAWLRGQSLAGVTLTQLQAINGTMSITIDGVVKSGTVNLAAATSFTNAATLIDTALTLSGAAVVTWDPSFSMFVVTNVSTGDASTITFGTGAAAAGLGLSAGVLSQGADADTPASAMDRIKDQNQNWATYMTVFEPNLDNKTAFAQWCNGENSRYAYVAWDTDPGYSTANNDAVFGSIVDTLNLEGTCVVFNTVQIAAFVCGYAGSIDWAAVNGRATPAFKQQSGLATSVDTRPLADAVLSNNASYYGLYQAPGQGNIYSIMYDGRMNGSKFRWLDTYLNQIYLNAQLQLAIFVGLTQVNAAPYNSQGETLIRAWMADPIIEALNNGTIRIGVPLSQSQKATIAMQAGLDISTQLETQGYYLQILPATAQVRQQRQSPPVKLWYMDGGAIQQITLASIAVL